MATARALSTRLLEKDTEFRRASWQTPRPGSPNPIVGNTTKATLDSAISALRTSSSPPRCWPPLTRGGPPVLSRFKRLLGRLPPIKAPTARGTSNRGMLSVPPPPTARRWQRTWLGEHSSALAQREPAMLPSGERSNGCARCGRTMSSQRRRCSLLCGMTRSRRQLPGGKNGSP